MLEIMQVSICGLWQLLLRRNSVQELEEHVEAKLKLGVPRGQM